MVRAYWLVGCEVVEEEQEGSARAGYGDELIDPLSAWLRAEFGRGYNPTNLRYIRLFYLAYPDLLAREIHHAVRDKSGQEARERGRPAATGHAPDRGVLNPDLVARLGRDRRDRFPGDPAGRPGSRPGPGGRPTVGARRPRRSVRPLSILLPFQ
jgi:hypothetical protein